MSKEILDLIEVVKKLRDPATGCPWDLEQTHESLLPYLIEEAYEFKSAVMKKDSAEMQDELGDVLLQVVLHTQLASEANTFDLNSVAKNLTEKLIRRHPHVFNNPEGRKFSQEEISANWKQIKELEREISGKEVKKKSAIDSRVLNAPSLKASCEIGRKTEQINFDWENAAQVAWKVEEEWQELKEELMPSQVNKERIAEELGDFLFSTAQLARHLGLEPEEVLDQANRKFLGRFQKMEAIMNQDGAEFGELKQEQLDHFWNEAKLSEKK